jgi:hypothetical protein
VEIIIAISCIGLLFYRATHADSSLSLYYIWGDITLRLWQRVPPPIKKRKHHPTFLREDYRVRCRYRYRWEGLHTH